MFMAILFVTVFVVDEETAVDASVVPLTVGNVKVRSLAVLGAVRVTEPPPVDLIATGIRQPSRQSQKGP
jgi:hypothetical protein